VVGLSPDSPRHCPFRRYQRSIIAFSSGVHPDASDDVGLDAAFPSAADLAGMPRFDTSDPDEQAASEIAMDVRMALVRKTLMRVRTTQPCEGFPRARMSGNRHLLRVGYGRIRAAGLLLD